MPLHPARFFLSPALAGVLLLFPVTVTSISQAAQSSLSEDMMADAVRYFGVLTGEDVSAKDGAWLMHQWAEDFERTPETVASRVEALVAGLERQQRAADAIALANDRMAVLKNAYCAAEQTSDPVLHRLREVLVSDNLVLAADCVFGFVVTRFDVDGLVASHALAAAATGAEHDLAYDRDQLVGWISNEFGEASPADKALTANGELRHALLQRFWSRTDGSSQQADVVRAISGEAAADLRGVARKLEELALSRLGDVDYLAKVGDATFTQSAMTTHFDYWNRIAGRPLGERDRAWMERRIIEEFEADPNYRLEEVATIEALNRQYLISRTLEEQAALVALWAANAYCNNINASNPDHVRFIELLFEHDPVVDADCGAGTPTLVRERDTVLARTGDRRMTRRDLEPSLRLTAIIMGRPLSAEEEAIVVDDALTTFENDPALSEERVVDVDGLLAEMDKYDDSHFLAADIRQRSFDSSYCYHVTSDDPYADDYLRMFQKGDAITFADCERTQVTTKGEIEAFIGVANFLAAINGEPALTAAEADERRQSLASADLTNAESWLIALDEWWSLLTLDEKAAKIAKVRQEGITLDAPDNRVAKFIESAKLEIVTKSARREQCALMAVIAEGNTAIYAAESGRYFQKAWIDVAGFSSGEYAVLASNTAAMAAFCS